MKIVDHNQTIINLIKKEYLKDEIPWYIGYSGGKDSSCVLKLVLNAIKQIDNPTKIVTIFYCDTGVENPLITEYVYSVFRNLKNEVSDLPIKLEIVKPSLNDRFFVKVIGRGYPTPTNIFRWCTDKLRINPVNKLLNKKDGIILLGIRKSESEQRDRTISKHQIDEYYLKQNSNSRKIFSPILKHSLEELWITLNQLNYPNAVKYEDIRKIYQDAENECPIIKTSKDKPCGNSRFGCWTCTVVRKDKSIKNLVENGYKELKPLSEFRDWIYKFRDDTNYRAKIRRNRTEGLGPITIKGRKIILEKLLETEKQVGYKLLHDDELKEIYNLWEKDAHVKEFQ